jgi:hypothetical protein
MLHLKLQYLYIQGVSKMPEKVSGVRSPHQNKRKRSYQYMSCPPRVVEVHPNNVFTHSFDLIKINIKNSMQDVSIMKNGQIGQCQLHGRHVLSTSILQIFNFTGNLKILVCSAPN